MMAYNHRKEEKKWLIWKEQEEKQMRELGVDEDTIQRLHTYDWQQFNKERQYQQRWREMPEKLEQHPEQEWKVTSELLLEEIEDERLLAVLRGVDKSTLRILLYMVQGYSSPEIERLMGIKEATIRKRISRLRKNI